MSAGDNDDPESLDNVLRSAVDAAALLRGLKSLLELEPDVRQIQEMLDAAGLREDLPRLKLLASRHVRSTSGARHEGAAALLKAIGDLDAAAKLKYDYLLVMVRARGRNLSRTEAATAAFAFSMFESAMERADKRFAGALGVPPFPQHMLLVVLGNMGWPRRAGFLGHRKVVEASLVDVGVEAMLRSAMALAVARRVLAMQLTMRCVAHMNFVPTESLAGTPKESEMESVMNDSYPWKRMWKANSLTPEATSRLESVPVQWDSVTSRRFLGAVLSCFVQTLMFSLRDTSGAKAALSGDLLREAELRPALHAAVAAGLRVDPLNVPTSIDQLAAQFESAIREYEGEFGALEPIDPKTRHWIEFGPEPAGQ